MVQAGEKENEPHTNLSALPTKTIFRRLEQREWWLWMATIVVTLLLTFGVVSYFAREEASLPWKLLSHSVRALIAIGLLFDTYAIYQQLQIHYVRRRMLEREEIFRLINENVADMIAVVGADGRRIYNGLPFSTE